MHIKSFGQNWQTHKKEIERDVEFIIDLARILSKIKKSIQAHIFKEPKIKTTYERRILTKN